MHSHTHTHTHTEQVSHHSSPDLLIKTLHNQLVVQVKMKMKAGVPVHQTAYPSLQGGRRSVMEHLSLP